MLFLYFAKVKNKIKKNDIFHMGTIFLIYFNYKRKNGPIWRFFYIITRAETKKYRI